MYCPKPPQDMHKIIHKTSYRDHKFTLLCPLLTQFKKRHKNMVFTKYLHWCFRRLFVSLLIYIIYCLLLVNMYICQYVCGIYI